MMILNELCCIENNTNQYDDSLYENIVDFTIRCVNLGDEWVVDTYKEKKQQKQAKTTYGFMQKNAVKVLKEQYMRKINNVQCIEILAQTAEELLNQNLIQIQNVKSNAKINLSNLNMQQSNIQQQSVIQNQQFQTPGNDQVDNLLQQYQNQKAQLIQKLNQNEINPEEIKQLVQEYQLIAGDLIDRTDFDETELTQICDCMDICNNLQQETNEQEIIELILKLRDVFNSKKQITSQNIQESVQSKQQIINQSSIQQQQADEIQQQKQYVSGASIAPQISQSEFQNFKKEHEEKVNSLQYQINNFTQEYNELKTINTNLVNSQQSDKKTIDVLMKKISELENQNQKLNEQDQIKERQLNQMKQQQYQNQLNQADNLNCNQSNQQHIQNLLQEKEDLIKANRQQEIDLNSQKLELNQLKQENTQQNNQIQQQQKQIQEIQCQQLVWNEEKLVLQQEQQISQVQAANQQFHDSFINPSEFPISNKSLLSPQKFSNVDPIETDRNPNQKYQLTEVQKAIIYPFFSTAAYYESKIRNDYKGIVVSYDKELFENVVLDNLQFKHFVQSNLRNKSIFYENKYLKIGFLSSQVQENDNNILKMTLYFINNGDREIQQLRISYEATEDVYLWTKPVKLEENSLLPGQQLKQDIAFDFKSLLYKIPNVSINLNNQTLTIPLPCTIIKFIQCLRITQNEFKRKWKMYKIQQNRIMKSERFNLNQEVIVTQKDLRNYFDNGIVVNDKKQQDAMIGLDDQKLGLHFSFINSQFLAKIITSPTQQCVVQLLNVIDQFDQEQSDIQQILIQNFVLLFGEH